MAFRVNELFHPHLRHQLHQTEQLLALCAKDDAPQSLMGASSQATGQYKLVHSSGKLHGVTYLRHLSAAADNGRMKSKHPACSPDRLSANFTLLPVSATTSPYHSVLNIKKDGSKS